MTCTASYTPTGADAVGSYTESASFSGDSNYGGASSSQTNNFSITSATAGTAVACSPNPSTYGTSVTCTATINGQYGQLKGRVRSNNVTGTVAWSANTGCGTTSVTSGNPGVATCITTILNAGSDTVMGTYSGDANHSGSAGSTSQVVNSGEPDDQCHVHSEHRDAEEQLHGGGERQFELTAGLHGIGWLHQLGRNLHDGR